jgi:hypothetical protein
MKYLTFTLAAGLLAATCPLFAGVAAPTPEPSTALLIGGGLGVMILVARKIRARQK